MHIDLSYQHVVVKPLTTAGRDTLIAMNVVGGFCGHKNWEVNVEQDLTAESTSATGNQRCTNLARQTSDSFERP